MKHYLIVNKTNDNLSWSNTLGWTEEAYDVFNEKELKTMRLPIDGEWRTVGWERVDPTEEARRDMLESGQPHADLAEAKERWDTQQMGELFTVHSFLAPFVIVTRKSDGVKGTLEFTHHPRWYFNFVADT